MLAITPVHLDPDTLAAGLATLERQVAAGDDEGARATLLGLAVPAMGVAAEPFPTVPDPGPVDAPSGTPT